MMRRIRARLHDEEQGFTLVELLVIMVILTIVGAITMTSLVQGMRTSSYTQDRGDALERTLIGMERMSRELRAADPLQTAAAGNVVVDIRRGGSLHRYHYEISPNGTNWDLEQVHWRFDDPDEFDAPAFVPTAAGADEVVETVLIRDLTTDTAFEFLDANGDPGATADQARQIRITVERLVDDDTAPIVVETLVKIRNA